MNIKKTLSKIEWVPEFYHWCWSIVNLFKVQWPMARVSRERYVSTFDKISGEYAKRKLKVVFPVSNISKWKVQSLYDLMEASGRYEPVVALTAMDIESELPAAEQRIIIEKNKSYFHERKIRCVEAFVPENQHFIPFDELGADIVCYTQPWYIAPVQSPLEVSKYALTCYVPYFVQNYGGLGYDCELTFHRCLWRHFTLNEKWAKLFMRDQGFCRAGDTLGLGHPMLDQYWLTRDECPEKHYVIYAPHFSCGVNERFSTFLKNGRQILALAKEHPEIDWVFKPHPSLRHTLEQKCGWTRGAVDEYYGEWERIGVACYDSDYIGLFKSSMAMITDCASFLVEYACTGSPIIHLISSEAKYRPHRIAAKLFSTYYAAHNWREFEKWFETVVIKGEDPKREKRLVAVKDMRLLDNYAAKRILDYLDEQLSSKKH